jgi:hypothetical protein
LSTRGTRLTNAKSMVKQGLCIYCGEESIDGTLESDDVYQVRSQDPKAGDVYIVMNGECSCMDKKFNGGQECKHELAVMIMKGQKIDNEVIVVKIVKDEKDIEIDSTPREGI